MAIIKYLMKNQCTLRYKTDIFDYNEYWYNETKNYLKPYQFVIIDYLSFPNEIEDNEIIEFIKEFSRLMTIENRIVIFDNEEFIKQVMNDAYYYDNYIDRISRILPMAGFYCIQIYDYSYLYKDVYLYAIPRLASDVYEIIDRFYGYNEDDYM